MTFIFHFVPVSCDFHANGKELSGHQPPGGAVRYYNLDQIYLSFQTDCEDIEQHNCFTLLYLFIVTKNLFYSY